VILLRRTIAFLIEFAVLSGIALAGLFWDFKTNALYGWNSVRVGYMVLVLASFALSGVPSQPLSYRAAGIRLYDSRGSSPTLFHRITRCLLFWVLVSAAEIFVPDFLLTRLRLSAREIVLLELAIIASVMAAPVTLAVLSLGRASIHDILTHTRVGSRNFVPGLAKSGDLERFRVRFVVGTGSLLLAFVLTCATLLDWQYRISDNLSGYYRRRVSLLEKIGKSAGDDPRQAADLIRQMGPRNIYVNSDFTAFLPGVAESFRVRVRPSVLADERRLARTAVLEIANTIELVAPPTKWIELDLYDSRTFGPATLEQGYRVLYDVRASKLTYAPTDQKFFYGKRPLSLTARMERNDVPDSVITILNRKLHRSLDVLNIGWDFPRLDLSAHPLGSLSRFVGRM
jgi:hypothetical protein